MKKLLVFIVFLFASVNFYPAKRIEINSFYYELSNYGQWVEIDYDLVAWMPRIIDRNWRPYSIGTWVWTDEGWFWDSYEPFGYIVYHYGRWFYDDYYGWLWIPANQWAPAWVEWRYDDDYVGWAPLSPYAEFSIHYGIRHHVRNYHIHYSHWNFVRYNYFCNPYVNQYILGPHIVKRVFSRTKYRTGYAYRNNRIINSGIDRNFVERRGRISVPEKRIERVADVNLLKQKNRNSNKVRVFEPKEKQMILNKNINIKRIERNTSLDTKNIDKSFRIKTNEKNLKIRRERNTEKRNSELQYKQQKTISERKYNRATDFNNSQLKRIEKRSESKKVEKIERKKNYSANETINKKSRNNRMEKSSKKRVESHRYESRNSVRKR